jgi:hypothetical protein
MQWFMIDPHAVNQKSVYLRQIDSGGLSAWILRSHI